MTNQQYLTLMKFPSEWELWGMIPDVILSAQMLTYHPGNENASEHDRYGAFNWWLMNNPTKEQLAKLAKLSWLDPDQLMAGDVRNRIRKAGNFDCEVEAIITIAT